MGTGEVTRYLAAHGPRRVKAAVLVAPLLPFLLKTNDNPEGIGRSVFDGLTARIAADRPAAMKDFLDRSYNVDLLGGDRVSDQAWQNSFYVAISASAHAAAGCVTACLEDFRGDLATISIPVLVIHGDQDRVLPYEATSQQAFRVAEEHPLHRHRGRAARDHLDPRRRGQPGTARLHRPPRPGRHTAEQTREPASETFGERTG